MGIENTKLEQFFKYWSVLKAKDLYMLMEANNYLEEEVRNWNSGNLWQGELDTTGQEEKGDFAINFFVPCESCTMHITLPIQRKVLNIWILEAYYNTSTK